ncbi:unnamed protein product [Sphagnum balticum]
MSYKGAVASAPRELVSFRMPTELNLIPIRLDLEFDGRKLKDAFSWNADDPDYEIIPFSKRMVKELNLPAVFQPYIAQAIQTQLTEFRSFEGQEMSTEERVQTIRLDLRVNNTLIHDQFLWDVNNLKSDPEGFARGLCKDLDIKDPEVAPAIAVAIREQLYEIAKQNLATGRETRISKKARRDKGAMDFFQSRFATWNPLVRRNEWDLFEPVVEILSEKEVEALYMREERNARLKKRQEEKDDAFMSRYVRV